jgi:hypothetical protein
MGRSVGAAVTPLNAGSLLHLFPYFLAYRGRSSASLFSSEQT